MLERSRVSQPHFAIAEAIPMTDEEAEEYSQQHSKFFCPYFIFMVLIYGLIYAELSNINTNKYSILCLENIVLFKWIKYDKQFINQWDNDWDKRIHMIFTITKI